MKKLFVFLLASAFVFASGCGNDGDEIDIGANVQKDGYSSKLLWERQEEVPETYEVSFDVDGDGQDDIVHIMIADGCLKIEALDKAYTSEEGEINWIEKVFGLDLDSSDTENKIAVITNEWSDDAMLRIFNFDGDIMPVRFAGDEESMDFVGIGYAGEISVTDKNVISSSCRGMHGMWSLDISYELKDGEFHEIKKEEREVVYPSYRLVTDNMTEEELIKYGFISSGEEYEALTEKGMVLAAADYDPGEGKKEGDGIISLNKGEYFKVTKENEDGRVYIVKDSGEEGYIDMSDWANNADAVSMAMFFLAD